MQQSHLGQASSGLKKNLVCVQKHALALKGWLLWTMVGRDPRQEKPSTFTAAAKSDQENQFVRSLGPCPQAVDSYELDRWADS